MQPDVQPLPGCTTDVGQYLKCLKTNKWPADRRKLEGFGLTFRLKNYANPETARLLAYLNGERANYKLAAKISRAMTGMVVPEPGSKMSPSASPPMWLIIWPAEPAPLRAGSAVLL